MLKVAFNAVPLLSPITGIGQYTLQLLEGLDAQNDMRVESSMPPNGAMRRDKSPCRQQRKSGKS